MADKFGEAILLVKADDTQLKATLAKDEALVSSSAGKMQGSLDNVTVSTSKAAGATFDLADAGNAASVASLAQVAGLKRTAVAASVAGASMGTLSKAIRSVSTASFGPLGLAIAAVAAFVIIAFNAKRITDWATGLDKANDRLKEQQARLREQEKSIKVLVVAQEQRLKIIKGEAVASDFIRNTQVQIATKAAEAAEAAKAARATRESEAQTIASRIAAMEKERLILTGQAKEHDFIKNALERETFLTLQKAKAAKVATDAAVSEAKAKKEARAAEGPGSFAEARSELTTVLAAINREKLILARRRQALSAEAQRMGFTQKQIQEVSDRLGLGFNASGPAAFQTLGTSGGRAGLGFTNVASIGDVAGSGPERKREKQLAESITVQKQTRDAVRENKPMGVSP